ncbi:MAG: hypothetical protein M3P22_01815 [bacterium]|nr:hypothetical protein [bacterium]
MNIQQNEVRNNIIELFEINKLPEDKQEETINRIGKIIFQSVLIRILPMMEEGDLEEYNKLMDGNADPDKVFDFFFAKVPNFLAIVAEESKNFRKEAGEALN